MPTDRLTRSSQRMASVTLGLIIAMLLLNAACWLWPALSSAKGRYGLGFGLTDNAISTLGIEVLAFPIWQTAGSIAISSVPLLSLAAGLWHLRCLFQCFGRSDFFSTTTAAHLEKVGSLIGLSVILNLLCEPLLSAWSTMREPIGHRLISVSFDSAHIVALFLAACIAIIARILQHASELESEHRQFV